MIDYAWKAGWPFKGTIALTMDIGTEQAFEFSVTYGLVLGEEPTWPSLWEAMWEAIREDRIALPTNVS
jgi:hypothetical protein